jgi:CopG family nickel-responsive transcriptional regulator
MKHTRAGDDPGTVRFSVSMEPELLARFDEYLAGAGWPSRSKALRDLVRGRLAERQLSSPRAAAVGVLSYIYNHDSSGLARKLMHLEHEHHAEVVSTVHVHLDRHSCLEVLIMRGRADRLRALADRLSATRGVRQGRLALAPAVCPLSREHHRKAK